MPGGADGDSMLGMNEIVIIILAIVLLLVGAKKIPELARAFGRAMGEFKRGKLEVEKELRDMDRQDAAAPRPKPKQDVFRAAEALGIETSGKSESQLRDEIAVRART